MEALIAIPYFAALSYVGIYIFFLITIPIGKILVKMPSSIDELYTAAEKTLLYIYNLLYSVMSLIISIIQGLKVLCLNCFQHCKKQRQTTPLNH